MTQKKPDYVALVAKYHPQGWDHSFWAAVIRRPGASRATAICRHQHGTREAAQECAEWLASLRNEKGKRC